MSLADLRRIQACRDRSQWNRQAKEERGFEDLVARYQAVYPDAKRRDWIEARWRAWQKGREG